MEIKTARVELPGETRLDLAVCLLFPEISRSAAARLIAQGKITVNAKSTNKSLKVSAGDEIQIEIPEPVSDKNLPENIPLDIVYEDDSLLVINKPKGMVVHPAAGNHDGTLVNALLYHCGDTLSGIGGVLRPGIVHRIDKDTSGLLMVAKNDKAHVSLALQIKEHSFTREYEGVVIGAFREASGTIDAPVGRSPADRKKMAVTEKNSKPAVTHYQTLARYNGYSHVRFILETGRTHQIRVHCAYLGHPVAGDEVYGAKSQKKKLFTGQCLHAKKIGFIHPETGEYMEFDSELPDYFKQFLNSLQ